MGRRPSTQKIDVVDILRSERDYKDDVVHDFQPVADHVHAAPNAGFFQWLVTADDRASGIIMRARKTPLAKQVASLAEKVLATLQEHRLAILADTTTPIRKLAAPLGRFTHLVVLSPAVTREGDENLSPRLWRAFPAFDCEAVGDEDVVFAVARMKGHASLPYGNWERPPHPVVDFAIRKKPNAKPVFKVYDPKLLDEEGAKGIPMKGAIEVIARNHAGELRSFVPGKRLPSRADLLGWFGFAR